MYLKAIILKYKQSILDITWKNKTNKNRHKTISCKRKNNNSLRYAAENLGMKVEWNQKSQTVTLKDSSNTKLSFQLNFQKSKSIFFYLSESIIFGRISIFVFCMLFLK